MTPSAAEREVRTRLFCPSRPGAPPRVGIEVEFLVMDRQRLRPVPPGTIDTAFCRARPSALPLIGELAVDEGWRVERAPGLPRFHLPESTVLSFEPGGQIELATAPFTNLDAFDGHLRELVSTLSGRLEAHGLGLLTRGLDPWTCRDQAELHLRLPRYQRMSDHYDRLGPAGRRMMRQSAGVHINLDFGSDPMDRWARTNALVPALTAMFANSHRREGVERGWRSERSATWRALDPSRTGVLDPSDDPVAAYTRFARSARAFLFADQGSPAPRWCEIEGRRSTEDWRAHLTTVFPEVRPRGYLELRCVDALPIDLVVIAAAVAAGVVHHPAHMEALGLPDRPSELLTLAGRDGVRDPRIRGMASGLGPVALEGLTELGDSVASASIRGRVSEFFSRFPSQGRDPGDLTKDWVGA